MTAEPVSPKSAYRIFFPLLLAMVINGFLLWYFHDRTWWPPDDGFTAHIAERIGQGEVPSRDVDQFVSGYFHLVNVAAFKLFGKDLLSLRYPFAAMALVQSLLAFFLFRPGGARLAMAASVVPTALGVLQYINPNQNWYALFMAIALAVFLTKQTANWPARFAVAGFMVVLIYMFRQLSGILAGIGTLSFLLYDVWVKERDTSAAARPAWLCRVILFIFLAGLGFYVSRMNDHLGIMLLGIIPILTLGWLLFKVDLSDGRTASILRYFFLGGLVAALPEVVYQLLLGNLGGWFNDTFLKMLSYAQAGFFKKQLLFIHVQAALKALDPWAGGIAWGNAIFWLGIFSVILWVEIETFKDLVAGKRSPDGGGVEAISFLSIFYAIVSLQYLIPHYIHETLPLIMLAWGWRRRASARGRRWVLFIFALWSFWAAAVYAGRPIPRGIDEIMQTPSRTLVHSKGRLPHVSLWMEEEDIQMYSSALALIERETVPGDRIFAVPYGAQFYFLSGRRNPFAFTIFGHGIQNDAQLQALFVSVQKDPPALIINAPYDKRQDRLSREFMEFIQVFYSPLEVIGPFEFYGHPQK